MTKVGGYGGVFDRQRPRRNIVLEESKDVLLNTLICSENGKWERYVRISSSMKGLVNYVKEFGLSV